MMGRTLRMPPAVPRHRLFALLPRPHSIHKRHPSWLRSCALVPAGQSRRLVSFVTSSLQQCLHPGHEQAHACLAELYAACLDGACAAPASTSCALSRLGAASPPFTLIPRITPTSQANRCTSRRTLRFASSL